MDAVEIQGRTITFPVEIRRARSWAAQFLVPAARAQRLIAHTGLTVAQPMPGRAMVALAFVDYIDGDLDAYQEVAVSVIVRPHDAPPASGLAMAGEFARQQVRAYIHQLPVNQGFTLEAGRTIWGYPKFMADIAIDSDGSSTRCTLRHDGSLILSLAIRDGVIPLPTPSVPTYSGIDGLCLTSWEVEGKARGRLGGARLTLGDHPIARDLRAVGLPKRALMTVTVPELRARFGPPERVSL